MRESAHEFHCTHAGRSTTIYYRHTADELDLPDELWELVRVKANLLTPSKKPIARDSRTRPKPVRRIHDIQNRLETMAAPRTARLARRTGPDMAYLNKTLAGIAGVEPEYNETPTSRQGIGLHAHFR